MVYGLGKPSTGQSLHMQIFHGEEGVVVDQLPRQLVLTIVALIEHTAGEPGHELACFSPTREPLRQRDPWRCLRRNPFFAARNQRGLLIIPPLG
jgi:hypothetical protein